MYNARKKAATDRVLGHVHAHMCLGGFFHLAHVAAVLSAATANLGTLFHVVAFDGIAGFCASFAYIRTSGADACVHCGIARHKIGGRLTYLYAINHEFRMFRFHMFAAFLKAMIEECFLTCIAAFPTCLDAVFHRLVFLHKISRR
jgi:hypothetical protein